MRRILDGGRLDEAEAAALVGAIMDGDVGPSLAAGLLVALAARGETHDEVAGAARAMRERCVRLDHELPVLVDIVGTGGDSSGTINISTMAALVVAAAGVPVAKHGNRAASGVCGSADVLEAAGLRLDASPQRSARMLRETNFTFLFAPHYHPAMKQVAPMRGELGVPTIFNLLGPLTNPARPTHLVVGVARPAAVEIVAAILERMGTSGAVVHGPGGMDEIAGEGATSVLLFGNDVRRFEIDPSAFGVHASLAELSGATRDACLAAFLDVLGGEQSARADVVALNAALALTVAGARPSLEDAFASAREVLASGEALRVFERAKTVAYA
ncbi:MAG TPA: anthranilate phosphoribosyltransferase [Candidatus Dormibacteraeota bacterium]|nr:anthranilate phosphoribosyltransferase [Candidatus Dormibacteraeota bacterium]